MRALKLGRNNLFSRMVLLIISFGFPVTARHQSIIFSSQNTWYTKRHLIRDRNYVVSKTAYHGYSDMMGISISSFSHASKPDPISNLKIVMGHCHIIIHAISVYGKMLSCIENMERSSFKNRQDTHQFLTTMITTGTDFWLWRSAHNLLSVDINGFGCVQLNPSIEIYKHSLKF